jgi:hypothetical protein
VPPANQNGFKVPPAILVEDEVDRILAKQVSTNQNQLKVPPANQNGFKGPPAIVVENEVDRILAKQVQGSGSGSAFGCRLDSDPHSESGSKV